MNVKFAALAIVASTLAYLAWTQPKPASAQEKPPSDDVAVLSSVYEHAALLWSRSTPRKPTSM